MKIFIRADASIEIGTGHVMRCLTLADELRLRGCEIKFICRDEKGSLIDQIEKNRYRVNRLTQCKDIEADRHLTQEILQGEDNKPEWLIVDNYDFDSSWETPLRGYVKKIMVIDDLAEKKHNCDLLLNQNLGIDEKSYSGLVPEHCEKLLGTEYALLRPQFLKERDSLRPRPGEVKRVLIFLGGADPDNVTGKAINAIKMLNLPDIAIDVVLGESNPNRDDIKNLLNHMPKTTLHISSANMAHLMANADLSIGSCGTTTWERCCLGLPSIIIGLSRNQLHIAKKLSEEGAIIYTGWFENITEKEIFEDLSFLLRHPEAIRCISLRSLDLVDGKGITRVVRYLLNMDESIHLRNASLNDCWKIYEWRNHPEIRKHFFDPSPISKTTHHEWFVNVVSSSKIALLIGEKRGGAPVGVLRYDFDMDIATVSVYVIPEFLSKGIGSLLLKAGNEWMKKEHPEVRKIVAKIEGDNLASQKTFKKVGFHESHLTYVYNM